MPRLRPCQPMGLSLLLGMAAVSYMVVMGHHDPLRLAVAALTGAVVALGVAPVLARVGG